ncbi:hypothetical protein QYE76_043441 [Lolium multiflorum]|uniref:Transposase (putative) gypsy type domain-containing protein n=1 Tax=Lolium multiflorum TaxID=4521 RepID=A0AAD8WY76_LOLMU|nr:hypothetical protein QYE76_043441 [Lolium multiflorum]
MATEDLEWERSKISNQDMNLLKRLGFTKEKDALRFPHEESYPKPPMEYRVSFVDHLIRGLSPPIHEFLRGLLFVYGLQLHQLTPNSILHVSIFITLCECFLGVQPNWALWKRIFCLRRNGSHGVAYNIGGVVICVRSDVDYFDVKFPDSVQGWRKRWLYVHEESSDSMEYNIAPFDGKAKILRRRSWDAEASEEEKLATEALMTRIRELQSTRGKELSGIQITAYFLRIRMQPLQARKNPLWMYAGDEDVERLSTDLSAKDLEKLIRRISKLSKKDTIPSSCKVAPFCRANPLPKGHLVLSSLPPLPEGGEVEERAVVTDDNQGASRPESGVGDSHKSAASLEKETEAEVSSSTRSSLPAASPKGKRKRDEAIDSGTSKANTSRAGNCTQWKKKLWIFTVLHSSAQILVRKYSRVDEINAQGPIFARSFQKTEREGSGATRRRHHRAARPGPPPTYGVGPRVAPRCPFAYLKPSRNPQPRYGRPSETPPPRIPSRGFGDRLRHLPERGFISGGLFIAMIGSDE